MSDYSPILPSSPQAAPPPPPPPPQGKFYTSPIQSLLPVGKRETAMILYTLSSYCVHIRKRLFINRACPHHCRNKETELQGARLPQFTWLRNPRAPTCCPNTRVSHKTNFLVYTETNFFLIPRRKLRPTRSSLGLWGRKPEYEISSDYRAALDLGRAWKPLGFCFPSCKTWVEGRPKSLETNRSQQTPLSNSIRPFVRMGFES